MRIGFVSLHTSPTDRPGSGDAGGMNVVELAQARALARLGHRVEIVTRRAVPDLPAVHEIAPGLTLRHLDVGPPEVVAKSAQEAFITDFSSALHAIPPQDVLVSQHWMSGLAALPVARARGIPHVQSFHSLAAPAGAPLSAGERAESAGRLNGEALLARESDLVLAISAAEARAVVERAGVERCGAAEQRVVVVRPGVDAGMFRPLAPGEVPWQPPGGDQAGGDQGGGDQGGGDQRGHLVFAARLQPLKAPDLAIEALAHVPEEVRPMLVVVGEESQDFSSYLAELQHLAERRRVADRVHFTGALGRPEFARVVRSSRLMLVPSHSETFGLVALEAAASGVPTVATRAGGLVESVAHGTSGVLLSSRDPVEWGAAITSLLTDHARRQQLADSAHGWVRSFRWSTAGRQVEVALQNLLREATPVPVGA